jgi:hypothetical protein
MRIPQLAPAPCRPSDWDKRPFRRTSAPLPPEEDEIMNHTVALEKGPKRSPDVEVAVMNSAR